MALSEIEKLERRYADNPQGLTFAPLAEVHRKNGDVPRALELLRAGLALHPDYIPASIVLGRCHLDLGDLPAAETAFTHVLGLDGENVIALKALADITERLCRFDEAERWLRTLLAVDRSNDEARDQLGRVETARRQAESASLAATATAPEAGGSAEAGPSGGGGAASEPAALVLEPAAGPGQETAADNREASAGTMSAPPPPEPPRDAMFGWVSESDSPQADEAMPLALEELDLSVESGPPPEGIELEQPITLETPVVPLAGIVGLSDTQRDGLEVGEEFRVETAEDIVLRSSGGSEFQVANASEELLDSRGFGPPEPANPPAPASSRSLLGAEVPPIEPARISTEGPAPAAAEPSAANESAAPSWIAQEAERSTASWAAPVAEPPRHPEPDLVVTESMAELLVQQGHAGEALTVYRHLQRRSPGEARFVAKIADLERVTTPRPPAEPAAAEPAAAELASAPGSLAAAPRPAYSVLETQGQSVQAFLRGVFGARLAAGVTISHPETARPAATNSADPDGAPTRPAHDSLSLSSVFGEESTPTPPAVPATGGGGQSGVSFDEFFGPPGASTAPRAPRAQDSKSDDLDQFHAWLQNLKR